MNPLARRRVAAYALDCLGYLGIAVATIPAGVLAARAGIGQSRELVLAASAVPVAIATAFATVGEARGHTWGKRRLGLEVERSGGGKLLFGRSLARNLVKVAIPWHLGHTVAIGAAYGGFDRPEPSLVAISGITYAVIGVGIWGVVRKSGLTVHDVVAGSRVVEAA